MPADWARFADQDPDAGQRRELAVALRPEHYPFWSQGHLNSVVRVDLFAQSADQAPATIPVADGADLADPTTEQDTLTKDEDLNDLLVGRLANVALPPKPTGGVKLYFEHKLSDLWIAVTWSG